MAPTFSLSAVLRVRERKQEQEERALAELGNQRRQLDETLCRITDQMEQWNAKLAQEVGTVCNAAAKQADYARYKALAEAKAQITGQLRTIETRWLEQKSIYLAARASSQILVELKEQRRTEWENEHERRETRALNDLLSARRIRK